MKRYLRSTNPHSNEEKRIYEVLKSVLKKVLSKQIAANNYEWPAVLMESLKRRENSTIFDIAYVLLAINSVTPIERKALSIAFSVINFLVFGSNEINRNNQFDVDFRHEAEEELIRRLEKKSYKSMLCSKERLDRTDTVLPERFDRLSSWEKAVQTGKTIYGSCFREKDEDKECKDEDQIMAERRRKIESVVYLRKKTEKPLTSFEKDKDDSTRSENEIMDAFVIMRYNEENSFFLEHEGNEERGVMSKIFIEEIKKGNLTYFDALIYSLVNQEIFSCSKIGEFCVRMNMYQPNENNADARRKWVERHFKKIVMYLNNVSKEPPCQNQSKVPFGQAVFNFLASRSKILSDLIFADPKEAVRLTLAMEYDLLMVAIRRILTAGDKSFVQAFAAAFPEDIKDTLPKLLPESKKQHILGIIEKVVKGEIGRIQAALELADYGERNSTLLRPYFRVFVTSALTNLGRYQEAMALINDTLDPSWLEHESFDFTDEVFKDFYEGAKEIARVYAYLERVCLNNYKLNEVKKGERVVTLNTIDSDIEELRARMKEHGMPPVYKNYYYENTAYLTWKDYCGREQLTQRNQSNKILLNDELVQSLQKFIEQSSVNEVIMTIKEDPKQFAPGYADALIDFIYKQEEKFLMSNPL